MAAQDGTGLIPFIPATRFVVQETSNMTESGTSGTITVQPDEQKTFLEWRDSDGLKLHAIGADDTADCEYILKIDNEIVARTQSPLGLINDPFSLTDHLDNPVAANEVIEYQLYNGGSSSVEMAGRMYLEVMG